MPDRTTFAPFVFFEYDHKPGNYCLLLSDDHMVKVSSVFAECDQYGNGYGWVGVAHSALQKHAPELAESINFDPEAGMFVAYGSDSPALERLGGLLRDAFADPEILKDLIASGDPAWFD